MQRPANPNLKIIDFNRPRRKKNNEPHVNKTLQKYIDKLSEDNKYILLTNAYDLYMEQCGQR